MDVCHGWYPRIKKLYLTVTTHLCLYVIRSWWLATNNSNDVSTWVYFVLGFIDVKEMGGVRSYKLGRIFAHSNGCKSYVLIFFTVRAVSYSWFCVSQGL